ncbi:MAG: FMN-binding negative transcriptional regulator, partial [bacterium]
MFSPRYFQQHDQSELYALMRDYPLAVIIKHDGQGFDAHHIPLTLSEQNGEVTLKGHIAKANSLWKQNEDSQQVLVIFNGPESYISPNYYPGKKVDGKVVPTWNYVAVHVRGAITFIHENEWKLAFLNELTEQHEKQQPQAWKVSDAPEEYIQNMLGAIVGFEIKVDSMLGQWKVSQNKDQLTQQAVVKGLQEQNQEAMAERVK